MEAKESLPSFLRAAFSEEADLSPTLCLKCGSVASTCVETSNELYKDGECYELSCGKAGCKAPLWAFCKTCKKRFTKRNLPGHVSSKEHRKKSNWSSESPMSSTGIDNTTTDNTTTDEFPTIHELPPFIARSPSLGSMSTTNDGVNFSTDADNTAMLGSAMGSFFGPIDPLEADVFLPLNDDMPFDDDQGIRHPKLCMKGNEKLNEFFQTLPEAEPSQIGDSMADLDCMRNFWCAEHASPEGHCGGGLQYIVGRSFFRPASGVLHQDEVPTIDESLWHLECFSQYLSMNDTQRQRQTRIMNTFQGGSMFQKTHVPTMNESSKIYGRQGQHSMWNTLPIPPIENVDGIGYASPIHIIKFLFSCGAPVDDMFVTFGCKESYDDGSTVNHVSESVRASEFIQDILRAHEEAVRFGQRFCLATWLADWRDGFGPNRTKGNRNSVVAWTITVSPPKNKVNATCNTFLVALGSKKNTSWPKVEHRFRNDMAKLSELSQPLFVYHGTLQKIIPVCCRRLASLEDKVERPDVTATIACTSDFHRCFGTAVRISTPSVDVKSLNQSFFQYERVGLKKPFPGWSDKYVHTNCNGARFPACRECRSNCWKTIFGESMVGSDVACEKCTNWSFDGSSASALLQHPPPDNYPKREANGDCPVQTPEGRPVPAVSLPPVRLSFEYMKNVSRYTFYHTSAQGKTSWGKGECRVYLRSCGIGSLHQEEILSAALTAKENNDQVDYSDAEGVGSFRFPASWIGDLTLHQYIELAMHQLFLGIAKSNFDLINQWIKATGFGFDNVKKKMQPLLKELKKLQLSFCTVHEFSGTEGTGAWVSENWLAFTRFSKLLYGNLHSMKKSGEGRGIEDVVRMVASYNALVSRLLTHSGINPQNISEIHLYMKEFLSCVRELDIRVHHKILAKKTKKKAPPKNKNQEVETVTGDGRANKVKKSAVTQQSNKGTKKATTSKRKRAKAAPTTENAAKVPPPHATTTDATNTGKKTEAWWLKSNYMSLMNLIQTLAELGPLVLWWDGGGKGERFIQDIKPHIPRGVRNDQPNYYVRLTERVYKMRCLYYLERRYCGEEIDPTVDMAAEAEKAVEDDLDDETESIMSESSFSSTGTSINDSESEDGGAFVDQSTLVSQVEDLAMHKARTIYVYRNEDTLIRALNGKKPLSGIIALDENSNNFDMFCIYRATQKTFGLRKVNFMDENGSLRVGLWHAPIVLETAQETSYSDFTTIQNLAKMAVVAIPYRYCSSPDHIDSAHYCAVTNWWKERNHNGNYVLPQLETELYADVTTNEGIPAPQEGKDSLDPLDTVI